MWQLLFLTPFDVSQISAFCSVKHHLLNHNVRYMKYLLYLWSDYRTEKTICLAVSPSLKAYGIDTMGKIARCSIEDEELLYQLFGVNAELLIDYGWGWEPCSTVCTLRRFVWARRSNRGNCKSKSERLKCSAILPVFFVFQHRKVGIVSALRNVMVFECLKDGTAWLMRVGTITETALFGEMENISEITGEFFFFHIKCAKALDSWSIYEVRGGRRRKRYHFTKRSGMHTCVVGIGNCLRAQIGIRYNTIDKR